jgi:hypothetical protein
MKEGLVVILTLMSARVPPSPWRSSFNNLKKLDFEPKSPCQDWQGLFICPDHYLLFLALDRLSCSLQ